AMRSRMITSRVFNGDRVLGAILFEGTMDRDIEGRGSADYLWSVKKVVPFLKVDKGLADEANGAQIMKPMPELDALLTRAVAKGIFGTKMRSVIKEANAAGITAVVKQQFEVGRQILAAGLVPIIEPEVDIHSPNKAEAEALLKAALLDELNRQPSDQPVMLKLTLPETDGFYTELVKHPSVLRVVALSGGYSREESNARLSRNKGVIASFSRALTEGLSAQQSEAEFNATLDVHRPGRRGFEELRQDTQQRVGVDVVVQTMNRVDAQLFLDQFADVGHGQLRRTIRTRVGGALFVAEGATDRVTMVTVGDHHVGRTDRIRDGRHTGRIVDTFDGVHDAVGLDHARHLAGFHQEIGQTRGQRQAPHGRQVGEGGTRQIQAIGLGLGGGAFMGQHAAGSLVHHLERPDDTDGGAGSTGLVAKRHAVDRERRTRVAHQNSVG
ncbi:MAG: fructose-bisphosphate aldolase class I, partial [Actinobacteria bacterium]|nr:fructose-bisphosphate aldolase class I [Actinomycetota bacterium]